jgi:hypothetical protein
MPPPATRCGQEALAQATHDEVAARVAASGRTVKHAPARRITVRAFVADGIAERRERGLDWKNDESRLRHHNIYMTKFRVIVLRSTW